jgi:hypothetical protein
MLTLLPVIAIVAGATIAVRHFSRRGGRRAGPTPPTLQDVLAVPDENLPQPEEYRFKQPHVLQLAVYVVASGLLLVALVWTLAAHGWGLLGLVIVAADLLLLFLHGVPLAVDIARGVYLTPEGIEARGLLKRRKVSWWEIKSFRVKGDLSSFRAEGLRESFSFSTSSFEPEVRFQMYNAIRAHLLVHQHFITEVPGPGARVAFLKSTASSIGIILGVAFAATFAADQLLPEGNVLGLRCSYASAYLRDKYDLPEGHGCVVLRVNRGTGAHEAGIREGDKIVAVEGVPITSGTQFTNYWESLDKHTQEFTVVRSGEPEELTLEVTLGGRGELPAYDENDPYYFYLRARGAEDAHEAILDFSKAIKLEPRFDLAYAYRGALYIDTGQTEFGLADLEKALDLDPELTDVHRELAWYHVSTGDYDTAAASAETAIALDGCEGAFETYNLDCHINHQTLSLAYGERGDPASLRRGVEEARRSIAFYPEQPRSYYLAAFYLESLEDINGARGYAAVYLESAAEFGEPGGLIAWAERLVSGEALPDEDGEPAEGESEPSAIFVEDLNAADRTAEGEPSVTVVKFAEERSGDAPGDVRYLTPDRDFLWAYIEFDNAANATNVSWGWTQNQERQYLGSEEWTGVNKGRAWIRLENNFPEKETENTLLVSFDGSEFPARGNILLRETPYIGPITFSADAEGSSPLLFHSGQAGQVFARFDHAGVLPESSLSWFGEKDGALVADGNTAATGSGVVTAPIELPAGLTPGVIDFSVYVDGELARTGALAVTTPEIAASPPFKSFQVGLGNDGNGGIIDVTREISRNSPEVYYAMKPLRLGARSTLSTVWYHDGDLYLPPLEVLGSDGFTNVLDILPGVSGLLEPGEYKIVVSLDTQPVYAEVVVVR